MNPFDLMKNFQAAQAKLGEVQSKIKDIKAEGSSGGDMVRIVMDGTFRVLSTQISKEAMEDPEMLADLVTAAARAAGDKVREAIEAELAKIGGPFPGQIPGL